ncbi:hypothetical protein EST38_g13597 [Candolleomyces aberdarensis]|uniref:HNH nuclease domain-containing protein n=1 Tax=Candolleomyces aberdarensis TaxID=2316362 RepID=A0A4Q2D292_9AGAR|nr:hypothetical protein EST38_g13597 [Candolleomyces aberdarensis]
MTQLSSTLPPRLQNNSNYTSAYNQIRGLENSLQTRINAGETLRSDMIACRILGNLIHFAPTDEARSAVVRDILSAGGDSEKMLDSGKRYFEHLLRIFKSNKGQIPTPSNHASRPSFDRKVDMMADLLDDAPLSHSTAKKRVLSSRIPIPGTLLILHQALVRDGYRCVITGAYDFPSIDKCPELMEEAGPDASCAFTELCHIFSASTSVSLENGDKRTYAATAYTIAESFGYTTIQQDLNGEKIHRLENVMTMSTDIHRFFDGLKFWLVQVGQDTYKVETFNQVVNRLHGGREVKFTTENPEELPVPSPDYLALHAACAKVAHLSGAAEYIETILRDAEEIPVLAADGSSGEVLTHLLRHVVAH